MKPAHYGPRPDGLPSLPKHFPVRALLAALSLGLLGACASPVAKDPSKAHLQADSAPVVSGAIPAPVMQTAALPKPRIAPPHRDLFGGGE